MRLNDDYQNPYEEDGRPGDKQMTGYERRKAKKAEKNYVIVTLIAISVVIFTAGVIAGVAWTLATMKGCQ